MSRLTHLIPGQPVPEMSPPQYGLFIHFGINTFTEREWGTGREDPRSYAPTRVEAEQWAATAREAGMSYLILVAKHHDGFCLWPSRQTRHHVGHSGLPTDVMEVVSAACAREGLKLAVYYSVWDLHEKSFQTDFTSGYLPFMLAQLEELLTGYGPVCELWLDGAWIHSPDEWEFPVLYDKVKSWQPLCRVGINQTIGHDIPGSPGDGVIPVQEHREGDPIKYFPSDFRLLDPQLPRPDDPKRFVYRGKSYLLPFEATLTVTGLNWFYKTYERGRGVSPESIADAHRLCFQSGNSLVVNCGPDRDGLIVPAHRQILRDAAHLIHSRTEA